MARHWISLYAQHIFTHLMTQGYRNIRTIRSAASTMTKRISFFAVIAVCIMSSWAVGTVSAVDVLIHDAPLGSEVIITVNSTDYTDYKTMTVQANDTLNVTFDIPQSLKTVTACAHVQQEEHLEDCSSGSGSADSKLDIYLEEIEIDNHEVEDHETEEGG